MDLKRRNILLGSMALAAAPLISTRGGAAQNRVSQNELDEAIGLHGLWLEDATKGRRCVFGGRNLLAVDLIADAVPLVRSTTIPLPFGT